MDCCGGGYKEGTEYCEECTLKNEIDTLRAENDRLRKALKSTSNEWKCEQVRAELCQESGRAANAERQHQQCLAALAPQTDATPEQEGAQ
jgi:hypothetical protein